MKKIFIITITLFFINKSFTQDYTPMLEIGKIWNMSLTGDTGNTTYFNLTVTETVEINNLTYYHIEASYNSCETFLREDISEKKVYVMLEGQEYLLYDFSLNIGDFIVVGIFPRQITSIEYGDFYGIENLRYYLLDNSIKLIEGIGFEHDGITNSFDSVCLSAGGFDAIQLVNMNQPLSINDSLLKNILIYPNPTKDILFIDNLNNIKINNIQIFNILGKQVLTKKQDIAIINIKNLNTGLYLVRINTDNGVSTKKIIKQ